jgi:hypothetical protein
MSFLECSCPFQECSRHVLNKPVSLGDTQLNSRTFRLFDWCLICNLCNQSPPQGVFPVPSPCCVHWPEPKRQTPSTFYYTCSPLSTSLMLTSQLPPPAEVFPALNNSYKHSLHAPTGSVVGTWRSLVALQFVPAASATSPEAGADPPPPASLYGIAKAATACPPFSCGTPAPLWMLEHTYIFA